MQCKICQANASEAFRTTVLGKYEVTYYRCGACGFMQTENPYWLAESYSSAITEADIGPVNRAIEGSKLIEGVVLAAFNPGARFLDYGGGYGLLVRLMRDRGFDFYWQDRYCTNLFAKTFVAQPGVEFELLTAFEVFEHFTDPLSEISIMLEYSRNVLFSTLLIPRGVTSGWWYFSPKHGQHIAFYTIAALQEVARRFNLHLATNGTEMHLLSQKPVSDRTFRFFARESLWSQIARRLLRRRMRRQSLLMEDFRAVSGYTI